MILSWNVHIINKMTLLDAYSTYECLAKFVHISTILTDKI